MRDIEPRDSREQPADLPGRKRPILPGGSVIVRPTPDQLMDAVATDLFLHANSCVREFGDFQLALSSWNEAEPLFLRLLYDPRFRELPWRRTHLWLVEDHPGQSGFPLIEEAIVAQADIPPEQVHRPSLNTDYQAVLQETLAWREKGQDRLDYALLPLLADGLTHGSPVAGDASPLIESSSSKIRMSKRLLEATRFIAIVALGQNMESAVKAVQRPLPHPGKLLAGDLRPIGGELRWYVDERVCDELPPSPPLPLE